ncbi:hypothetical protein [Peribacillus frigoritolerans]|uniref:hypothetical protein n=1 Tax=Peribacillus frigoritolerans TaxID=450367 RepID=UPI00227E3DE5|nr:hypothetical protein [Peribacillus frigoritolerans]MCY9139571.1 hypothetical protein [Peribacillus frigoritolerans]
MNILETLQMVNLSQENNHPTPLPAKLPLKGFNLWVIGRFIIAIMDFRVQRALFFYLNT